MTSRRVHLLSIIPIALLSGLLGYHPIYWAALVIGVLLPEVDTVSSRFHRSWLFHTFLPTAIMYQILIQSGIGDRFPYLITAIHFVTIGLFFHFLFDYVYPKNQTNEGAAWPVKPTFFSEPWGLLWLGFSWFVQWFIYLSGSFIPWVFGLHG